MKKIYIACLFFIFSISFLPIVNAETKINSYKIAHKYLPKNGVRIPFLKVKISAIDDDVLISGFQITRQGLSSFSDFGRIWAETEDDFKSFKRKLNTDDFVEISFRKIIKIPKGQNQIFEIYANLNVEGSGKTMSLSLAGVLTPNLSEAIKPTIKQKNSIKKQSKIYCRYQKCWRR